MTLQQAEVIALAKVWRSQFWMPINEATKNFDYRIAEQLAAAVDRLNEAEQTPLQHKGAAMIAASGSGPEGRESISVSSQANEE